MTQDRPALPVILAGLCTTQIIAWGVLYYAFPVLSARIAEDTGWSTSSVTLAYSAGLVVSALLGIPVGKMLDQRGPRLVMTTGSVLGVLGLTGIACARTTVSSCWAGWWPARRWVYLVAERRLSVLARHMWVYGLLAVSTAALAIELTHAGWLILIAMAAGAGRGVSTLLKATAVTDRWGTRAYGRLSGVFNAPVMFGIAVAPALGAWLAEVTGSWEAMYLVLTALGGLAVLALIFSVPGQRPFAPRHQ